MPCSTSRSTASSDAPWCGASRAPACDRSRSVARAAASLRRRSGGRSSTRGRVTRACGGARCRMPRPSSRCRSMVRPESRRRDRSTASARMPVTTSAARCAVGVWSRRSPRRARRRRGSAPTSEATGSPERWWSFRTASTTAMPTTATRCGSPTPSTTVASCWRRYRGRSSLSHPVQAAQHYAREMFGDDRIESFPPVAEEARRRDAPRHGDVDGWRVRLQGARRRRRRRARRDPFRSASVHLRRDPIRAGAAVRASFDQRRASHQGVRGSRTWPTSDLTRGCPGRGCARVRRRSLR